MTTSNRGALFWAPRILTMVFALFLSVFALDVFAEPTGFVQTLGALVVHLMPTFLVVAVLILAWRWELIGVSVFAALAFVYVVATRGRFPLATYTLIAGPLLTISVLFLLSWRQRPGAGTGRRPLDAA